MTWAEASNWEPRLVAAEVGGGRGGGFLLPALTRAFAAWRIDGGPTMGVTRAAVMRRPSGLYPCVPGNVGNGGWRK